MKDGVWVVVAMKGLVMAAWRKMSNKRVHKVNSQQETYKKRAY